MPPIRLCLSASARRTGAEEHIAPEGSREQTGIAEKHAVGLAGQRLLGRAVSSRNFLDILVVAPAVFEIEQATGIFLHKNGRKMPRQVNRQRRLAGGFRAVDADSLHKVRPDNRRDVLPVLHGIGTKERRRDGHERSGMIDRDILHAQEFG